VVQRISDYNFGPVFTNCLDQLALMGFIIFKETVCQSQIFPAYSAYNSRRPGGFLPPGFNGTSGAQFRLGQIQDTYFFTIFYFIYQSAGTTQFHIVRMNTNCEYIYLHILSD